MISWSGVNGKSGVWCVDGFLGLFLLWEGRVGMEFIEFGKLVLFGRWKLELKLGCI